MDRIPRTLVREVEDGARQVRNYENAECEIIASGDRKNRNSIRNNDDNPEGDGLHDRSGMMFIECHVESIAYNAAALVP